jgi:hypothetical protein
MADFNKLMKEYKAGAETLKTLVIDSPAYKKALTNQVILGNTLVTIKKKAKGNKPATVPAKVTEVAPDDFYKPNGLDKLFQAQDKNKPKPAPVKETSKVTVIKWNE